MHQGAQSRVRHAAQKQKNVVGFLLFPGKRVPWLWPLTSCVPFLRLDEAPLPPHGED